MRRSLAWLVALLSPMLVLPTAAGTAAPGEPDRPNVLWITCEDMGPNLGCYGDPYARSPNIDTLAARSLRYEVAWSNAPVCAPARTAIVTGVYPPSTGAQHMRSMVEIPEFMRLYPEYLREAGYYCTNNVKEDYNVPQPRPVWHESSREAHWRNREEGQPFFAVFNFTETHEGPMRRRTEIPNHDPADAPLPPYHPDHPEVRRDWAQYYHNISVMDRRVGDLLEQLEEDGLADNTIVFFYSDHGSGMPRHKRCPYDSGLHVPLLVHVPQRYRRLAPDDYEPPSPQPSPPEGGRGQGEGGRSTRRLVSFVDLAPTLLSIAGIEPPEHMHGRAFMGRYEAEPNEYLFGFRGRMDDRYDMVRSVRNDRYIYVRNYMPHLTHGQFVRYMFQTPTTRVWQQLYREGALEPPQTYFWEPKPAEELYDLQTDPHEVHNLVDSPEHRDVLDELRRVHREHVMAIRDVGFLPEAEMHRRAREAGTTIHEMAQDPERYPLERIFAMVELAAARDPEALSRIRDAFDDADPAVRYWALIGVLIRGADAFEATAGRVRRALNDDNPAVRIAAAEVLVNFGDREDFDRAVETLVELAPPDANGAYVAIMAWNVIVKIEQEVPEVRALLEDMPLRDPNVPNRPNDYVPRLVETVLERWQ